MSNFIDDQDKMRDFLTITKEEFLASYSYLNEEEYENTKKEYREKGLGIIFDSGTIHIDSNHYAEEYLEYLLELDNAITPIREMIEAGEFEFDKSDTDKLLFDLRQVVKKGE